MSSPQGFDSVVIHYDAFPNCENAAPIFVADNMTVTPAPALWIDNVAVAEGNAGTATLGFTVSLSPVSGQSVTVDFATADGTATTADGDYVAASGTLTFAPGVASHSVSVTVNGDVKNEADETLSVNLTNASGASILGAQGLGTIGLPRFEIRSGGVTHAAAGLNWVGELYAEVYLETSPESLGKPYGKSVLSAITGRLLAEGNLALLRLDEANVVGHVDAYEIGFRRTGERSLVCQAVLRDGAPIPRSGRGAANLGIS